LPNLFLDAPGDDTDHARMPAFARDQRDRAVVLRGHRGFGGFLHLCLDRATFLVQPVKLLRDRACLVGIGRWSAGARQASDLPTRPPALMRGPSAKPRSAAGRRAVEPRCRVDQRVEPDIARPAITFSPCATKARG
jgi:hypothetical protein